MSWRNRCTVMALAGLLCATAAVQAAEVAERSAKKIVLLAGRLDAGHPQGTHEYERTLETLRDMLENSPLGEQVRIELHYDGWPRDERTLDDADSIVLFSNGGDRDEQEHPLLVGDRWSVLRRQMQRGCGLVLLHWSTFLPQRHHDEVLEWVGGYFDYQGGPAPRNWYSKIQHATVSVQPGDEQHPIVSGLKPFELTDEYYYQIRFRDGDERVRPILVAPIPGEEQPQTVAWAVERADGGRGFAFTGCHYLNSLELPHFRRMMLNGIAWSARLPIPPEGLSGDARRPIKAVILTGHQYPGHAWRETTLALEDALAGDTRFEVDSVPDPEFLASRRLHEYDVVLLNYCNWEQPDGLSEDAKANFVRYLEQGGGLFIVHFTNGAFHFSLPQAAASDWPEWRTKICRRVWDHTEGKSGHDPYGPMTVDIADPLHPTVRGMSSFETTDELYFRQQGDEPIHVVATARSKVTNQDEPMAFVYRYGNGHVFQTVLGHAAESLRSAGTAELVRRGMAWAAGRQPRSVSAVQPPGGVALAEGRFGRALDARRGGLEGEHRAEYETFPLTVDCWVQAYSKDNFNIFVAKNPKSSPQHWELYSYVQTGEFSVYMPGYEPAEIRSGVPVTDGQWHHVAMSCDGRQVKLYVDGKLVREEVIRRIGEGNQSGPLWIGTYAPDGIGCQGLVDEVRISKGIRTFEGLPSAAPQADDDTVELWHFDEAEGVITPAAAPGGKPLHAVGADVATAASGSPDHFDGFQESHVVDNRWQEMDTGPFFSGTIGLPAAPTWKGIVVRVGERREASVCYDTELLRVSGAWPGFLDFSPARFGLIEMPRPAAKPWFEAPAGPGWAHDGSFADPRPRAPYGTLPRTWGRYKGLYLHGQRVLICYQVGTCEVRESPWLEQYEGIRFVTRTLEVGPAERLLEMELGTICGAVKTDSARARLRRLDSGATRLLIEPGDDVVRLKLLVAEREVDDAFLRRVVSLSPAVEDVARLASPGGRRWGDALVTQGQRAGDDAAYVVDTLTMPYENPYGALMFASGQDFFPSGDAAVCTVHGDVWLVGGIDDELQQLRWKRFATGLFQPLGLLVRDGHVLVVGRDQITVLRDHNGDGEADEYENLNNEGHVTANGHEYVACLEEDSQGWLYFLKGDSGGVTDHDGTLLRVSPDGAQLEVFATGIRNGNGLAIGPDDVITFSPQEGNWTPGSAIFEARQGGFYGMMPSHHRTVPPTSMDSPLCWIPRWLDNSSGSQVWATSERFGPLSGGLLHLSFGRCRALVVLREVVEGQSQGGTVPLDLEFLSGVMRGRFRAQDGQLYVTGLMGWVTSAVREGCFQRVRYTGRPLNLPTALHAHQNGLAITFSDPLDEDAATEISNYAIEQWNYRWSSDYGSPDVRPSDESRHGHDAVVVRAAHLLADGRTVFLEIPDIRPVMQMSVTYALRAADGTELRSGIYNTIHRLGPAHPAASTGRRPAESAAEVTENVKPGLWATFTSRIHSGAKDARSLRIAALFSGENESVSSLLPAGPFAARVNGYVRTNLPDEVRFRMVGRGEARLWINGLRVLDVTGDPWGSRRSAPVALEAGLNSVVIEYESPVEGAAKCRLLWSSDRFGEEPIAPELLVHAEDPEERAAFVLRDKGRWLYAQYGCGNCHAPPSSAVGTEGIVSWKQSGPDLSDVADRIQPGWIERWLAAPHALQPETTMPQVLAAGAEGVEQARHIAAFLLTLGDDRAAAHTEIGRHEDQVSRGEELFESLGCISCHSFGPPEEDDPFGRRSLHFAGAKYREGALAAFLRRPDAHRPSGSRMPDFQLRDGEAADLAQYIRSRATGELVGRELAAGDPERGAILFSEIGCRQCHSVQSLKLAQLEPSRLVGPVEVESGCLSFEVPGRAPRYGLSEEKRAAISAHLAAAPQQAGGFTAAEFAGHVIEWLRCNACHDRGQSRSAWPQILAEEGHTGRLAEKVPDLTWTGEKLKVAAIHRVLSGQASGTRPWLVARMPAFRGFAADLARGLAAEHGIHPDEPDESLPAANGERQLAELLLSKRGLDCAQCHAPAGELLDNKNQAQGIGLAFIADRLRREYFYRWMRDPLRIDPTTKMPQFTLDGRKTQAAHLAGGDAQRQFRAIWSYLQQQRQSPQP